MIRKARKILIFLTEYFFLSKRSLLDRKGLLDFTVYEEPAETISYRLNIFHSPPGRFSNLYGEEFAGKSMTVPVGAVAEIPNVTIHGKVGIAVFKRKLILEPALNKKYYLNRTGDLKFLSLDLFKKKKMLKGQHVLLAGSVADNYFMWVVFFLPLIRLLEKTAIVLADFTFILGANYTRFQIDSLKALGISRIKIMDGTPLLVEKLNIPTFQYLDVMDSQIGHYNVLSKRSIEWLNTKFFRTSTVGRRKIILSRMKAATRRILNEAVLIKNFEDFETIVLEDLSFEEQILLFNQASVVISPHGAGLTNLVFGRNITVFEFYPHVRRANNPKNLQICDYLGHEYHLLILEAKNEQQDMELTEENLRYIEAHLSKKAK